MVADPKVTAIVPAHTAKAAAKRVFAGLTLSPMETARKVGAFCRRELGYWTLRLKHLLQPPARVAGTPRPFGEFDPREGVDATMRTKPRYRSSLARQAEARSNRRSGAIQVQARQNSHN